MSGKCISSRRLETSCFFFVLFCFVAVLDDVVVVVFVCLFVCLFLNLSRVS